MVQVKFKTFGANSAFGSFAPGDTMRCSEAMAKHLVEEMRCAVYVAGNPVEEAKPVVEVPKNRGRKAK